MIYEKKDKEQLLTKNVRMPLSLADMAHKQAKAEHRTFAGLVNVAVIKYLESQKAV